MNLEQIVRPTELECLSPSPSQASPKQALKYPAVVDVFEDDDGHLKAQIDTERLTLTSALEGPRHLSSLCGLYGSAEAMRLYGTGQTKSDMETDTLLRKWSQRWTNKDPFSGFTVQLRDTDEFVGSTVLGRSGEPGEAEFAFALMPQFWNKRYGTECGSAIVHSYADHLVAKDTFLDDVLFSGIQATARTDNPKSYRCLETLGFKATKSEVKFGALRHSYLLILRENHGRTA